MVAMFGRRIFGKQQHSFAELKKRMRPTPDADGVTRVFSKELWDDPKIGSMLRELGFAPDDQRNIMRTADDYIALFATAKYRLQKRSETFNRDMAARHGYCRAAPFLVIDQSIWDGEHGAFLYAQMDLIGFDDWNVIMLAVDARTTQLCGLPAHPGAAGAHPADDRACDQMENALRIRAGGIRCHRRRRSRHHAGAIRGAEGSAAQGNHRHRCLDEAAHHR